MTGFEPDPAALAWARGKVQEYCDRLAGYAELARAGGDLITAIGCDTARAMAERYFLGDGGIHIGVFEDRLLLLPRDDEPQP